MPHQPQNEIYVKNGKRIESRQSTCSATNQGTQIINAHVHAIAPSFSTPSTADRNKYRLIEQSSIFNSGQLA